jgi:putative hemolysin
MLNTLSSMYQMRMNRIYKFKSKIQVYAEIGPFLVKSVTTTEELRQALELRYQIFHREMKGKTRNSGVDVDSYDFQCDHLVILEKKSGKTVGTCRLNSASFRGEFYSAREFELGSIFRDMGPKLEVGRVCIHQDYRSSLVLSLLWRGIAEYMSASRFQILFGCTSIKTQCPREASLLYRYFQNNHRIISEYATAPTPAYTMPKLDLWLQYSSGPLTEAEIKEVETLIPPLCNTYLKMGAYIGGEPAWDAELRCIDFLTILHREDLNRTLWKRFKMDSEAS